MKAKLSDGEKFYGVNWNVIEDDVDKQVWDKLQRSIWVPEAVAMSNDIPSWNKLDDEWKTIVLRNFVGLTLLDTLQTDFAAFELSRDAVTEHEKSVYAFIAYNEANHAKSYSYIFQTLADSDKIEWAFDWSENNEYLQNKAKIVYDYYVDESPLKKKVASVFLESFLFYSGFYLPFYMSGHGKLTNAADIIRLILREESVHGYYIGYKYQSQVALLPEEEQEEIKEWAYDLLSDLYENEVKYAQSLYDGVGLTEDVKVFMRYNANKALDNLGYEPLFASEQVNPIVLNSLSLQNETHDFFSGKGSSYAIATVEEVDDDDFDF